MGYFGSATRALSPGRICSCRTRRQHRDYQISTRKSIFTIKRHRSRQPRCFEAFGQISRQPMSHSSKVIYHTLHSRLLGTLRYRRGFPFFQVPGRSSDNRNKRHFENDCYRHNPVNEHLPELQGFVPKNLTLFFLVRGNVTGQPITITWLNNNVIGHHKRGIAIATQIALGNCGGIVASNIFFTSEAPTTLLDTVLRWAPLHSRFTLQLFSLLGTGRKIREIMIICSHSRRRSPPGWVMTTHRFASLIERDGQSLVTSSRLRGWKRNNAPESPERLV